MSRIRMLALAVAVFATFPALACGLEDPNSIAVRRGVLQLAYPQALHVGTAQDLVIGSPDWSRTFAATRTSQGSV